MNPNPMDYGTMSSMENQKTRICLWRILIFCVCTLICFGTLQVINLHYDPLSRYPYGTSEERDKILANMSPDDIDWLINSQMDPDVFLPFVEADHFNIRNAYYYQAAMQTREAQPEIIVDFVNNFRDRFSLETMESVLEHYTYSDLSDYFDGMKQTSLVENPDDMLLVLDVRKTVLSYKPSGLRISPAGFVLKNEAMQAFEQMQQDAAAEGLDLEGIGGYVSYNEQKERGSETNYRLGPVVPYGNREEQLGWTVSLSPARTWKDLSGFYQTSQGYDYEGMKQQLDWNSLQLMDWLDENAADYGFVVRDPFGKEGVTGFGAQPFVLRYVGVTNAQSIHEEGLSLDEYAPAPALAEQPKE